MVNRNSESAPRVIVVGGINVDLVAAPVNALVRGTSNPGHISVHAGGVARNIAEFLRRLSVPVALAGRVGRDPFSHWIVTEIASCGVDVTGIGKDEGSVGFYVTIQEDGDLGTAVSDLAATERITAEDMKMSLSRFERDGVANCPEILILDCNLLPETLQAAISWANRRGVFVVIEPVSCVKARRLQGLQGRVDVITPNEAEERELREKSGLTGGWGEGRNLPDIRWWAVTRGAVGAALKDGHGSSADRLYPGKPVQPVNANGAGDAFVAGMVWSILKGFQENRSGGTVDWDAAMAAGLVAGRCTVLSANSVPTDMTETALLAAIKEVGNGT